MRIQRGYHYSKRFPPCCTCVGHGINLCALHRNLKRKPFPLIVKTTGPGVGMINQGLTVANREKLVG